MVEKWEEMPRRAKPVKEGGPTAMNIPGRVFGLGKSGCHEPGQIGAVNKCCGHHSQSLERHTAEVGLLPLDSRGFRTT
jgi:hypothetical protein